MDDAIVERCAKAAWEAGRCSPPWGSRSQLEANRETYRRSARVVLEEAMRVGFLPPDSAARLREFVRVYDIWERSDIWRDTKAERMMLDQRATLTDADLGIETEETK